jgi:hypothetical protein
MKLNVYNDPGHGWVAIKRDVLIKLGIEHKVSYYSYQRGQTVYLEEDCDMSLLISAARDAGITFGFVDKYTQKRSPIRSYAQFKPTTTGASA